MRSTDADPLTSIGRPPARITYLIKYVERGIHARLDEILHAYGITAVQYTALSVLRLRRNLSSAQLARRSFVSAQAMNVVVGKLERAGLIERHPHPSHRRVLRANLTPSGANLLASCDRAVDQLEEQLLVNLSLSGRAELHAALEECALALGPRHSLFRTTRTEAAEVKGNGEDQASGSAQIQRLGSAFPPRTGGKDGRR